MIVMKKIFLLTVIFLSICPVLFGQYTSTFTRYFGRNGTDSSAGIPLTNALIYLVPDGNTYPTGALRLTEHSSRKGYYYRNSVTHGIYDIWVNLGAGAALYEQDVFIGSERVAYAGSRFDENAKITQEGIKELSIPFNRLTQAAQNMVTSGGNVVNNPDDETMENIDTLVIGLKNSFSKFGASTSNAPATNTSKMEDALTFFGGEQAQLIMPESKIYEIGAMTITSNVHIHFQKGSGIEVPAGDTIVIEGSFSSDDPLQQIFYGDGFVDLSQARITEVYPEWWGVTYGDGSVDNSNAINKAIRSISGGGGIIKFQPKTYMFDSVLVNYRNITIEGSNFNYLGGGTVLKALSRSSKITIQGVADTTLQFISVRNLSINGNDSSDVLLHLKYLSNFTMDNVLLIYGRNTNLLMSTVENAIFNQVYCLQRPSVAASSPTYPAMVYMTGVDGASFATNYVNFNNCIFENYVQTAIKAELTGTMGGYINHIKFNNCKWENDEPVLTIIAEDNSPDWQFSNCSFQMLKETTGQKYLITINGSGTTAWNFSNVYVEHNSSTAFGTVSSPLLRINTNVRGFNLSNISYIGSDSLISLSPALTEFRDWNFSNIIINNLNAQFYASRYADQIAANVNTYAQSIGVMNNQGAARVVLRGLRGGGSRFFVVETDTGSTILKTNITNYVRFDDSIYFYQPVRMGAGLIIQGASDYETIKLRRTLITEAQRTGLAFGSYDVGEEYFSGILGFSDASGNTLNIGGGSNNHNSATNIKFYRSSAVNTLLGTTVGIVDANGWTFGSVSGTGSVPLNVSAINATGDITLTKASGWATIILRGSSGNSGTVDFYNGVTKLSDIFAPAAGGLIFRTNGTTTALTIGTDQAATFSNTVDATGFKKSGLTGELLTDGDKGDIVVGGSGTTLTFDADALSAVINAAIAAYIAANYTETLINYKDHSDTNQSVTVLVPNP
jgi:hypothetical protein